MPRKPLTLGRAPHDGKVYLVLNLKVWQTAIAVLLGLIALYGAGRAALSGMVARIAAEQARQEVEKACPAGLDEWRKGIEAQLGGLRKTDSELKQSVATLQENDLTILKTIAEQKR